MTLDDFEVGMRVLCVKPGVRVSTSGKELGKEGTIGYIDPSHTKSPIGVVFDVDVGGHNLDGRSKIPCRSPYGWWMPVDCLEPLFEKFELDEEKFFKILSV